jgi:hypothetical protein
MSTVISAGNATTGLSFTPDNAGTFEFKTGTGAGTTAMTIDASQAVTIPGALTVTGALNAGAITNTTGSFSGNLSFNSGYGSAAVAYGCRAWVNFNGTGTVAIRASGNVTSITDNGTGDYTVNFTTAMPDANYAAECLVQYDQSGSGSGGGVYGSYSRNAPSASAARFHCQQGGTLFDCTIMAVTIFR